MEIGEVMEKHRDRLMQLANVVGVGIGEKSGKAVIKVFVTEKMPENALRPDEIVPKKLDGQQTDVEVIGSVRAQ